MSPRTPKQFKEIRDEKVNLIMEVALEHFAGEGYYRTTINHIARHARISKGLMYNYFESKEALLKAIVHKSVNEIYHHFDIDMDGYLSANELEIFIRKLDQMLKEKKSFWRLLFQLLSQKDVRDQFLNAFTEPDSLLHPGHEPGDNYYPGKMIKMITEYFKRKKEILGEKYDPGSEIDMFFITILGFAVKTIYSETDDNSNAVERIIELFK